MAPLRRLRVLARLGAPLACAVLAACRSPPSEPDERVGAGTTGASTRTAEADPRRHETHRILEGDHRHIVPLRVDDRIVLPVDSVFDWRVEFEDPSAFARFPDGATGGIAYRVTKAGPLRMRVFGDPVCRKADAACGTSRRQWDVTLDVK